MPLTKTDKKVLLASGVSAFGLAGLAIAIIRSSAQGPPSSGTAVVTVTVLDSTTKQPVPYPEVTLGSTITAGNSSGVAVFNGIPFGIYSLSASASGYISNSESATISQAMQSLSISLKPSSSCTPTQCPCGQSFDPVSCKCAPVTPASIEVDSSALTEVMSWFVEYCCSSHTVLAGALADSNGNPVQGCPTNLVGCPTATGSNGRQWSVMLAGTVYDSDGKPMCGQKVDAAISQGSFPWSVTYMGIDQFIFCNAMATGTIELSIPSSGSIVTDMNGRFHAELVVSIAANAPSGWTGCGDPGCCPETLNSQNFDFTDVISFSIPGTNISPASTVITFKNVICENEVFC